MRIPKILEQMRDSFSLEAASKKVSLVSAEQNLKIARVVFVILGTTSLLSFNPFGAAAHFGAAYLTHEVGNVVSNMLEAKDREFKIAHYKDSPVLEKILQTALMALRFVYPQ